MNYSVFFCQPNNCQKREFSYDKRNPIQVTYDTIGSSGAAYNKYIGDYEMIKMTIKRLLKKVLRLNKFPAGLFEGEPKMNKFEAIRWEIYGWMK